MGFGLMKLDISAILMETVRIIGRKFFLLFGVWAAFMALRIAVIAIGGAITGGLGVASTYLTPSSILGGGAGLAILLTYIAYLLVVLAGMAGLSGVASPVRHYSFGEAFGAGLRGAPALLAIAIMIGVVLIIGAIVAGEGVLWLPADKQIHAILIGCAALLILGTYLACRLALVFPIVAVERVRNPLVVLKRSWELTRHHVVTIFLATLAFAVLVVVLYGLAVLPIIGSYAAIIYGGLSTVPGGGAMIVSFLAAVLVSIVISFAYAVFLSVIHAGLVGAAETTAEAL
ncbi:hypothetical protein EB810_04685 [Altererythrobacter sp. FM1]|nr:hypothetical protein EB810_04685 [Altererythrobacter sp. FM1]